MLLLVILLINGILSEPIQRDELASFLSEVLSKVGRHMEEPRAMDNIDIGFSKVIFGLRVEMLLETDNATITGPGSINSLSFLHGDRTPSGVSFVRTTQMALSPVYLHLPYILVDMFGYRIVTEAQMSMHSSTTEANLHFTKPSLGGDCLATAVVTRPRGIYSISVGSKGTFLFILSKLLTTLFQLVSDQYSTILYHYFPDISPDLEKVITDAICDS